MRSLARPRWLVLLLWIGIGPLREARGRTLIATLAIALGLALGFAVYLVDQSAAEEMSAATRSLFGEADLVVQGGSEGFDENLYPLVAKLAGVAHVSPVVEVTARVPGHAKSLTITGLDPFRARFFTPIMGELADAPVNDVHSDAPGNGAPGNDASPGNSLEGESLLLSAAAAREFAVHQGDDIHVQVGLQTLTFRVAGIIPTLTGSQRSTLQDLAAMEPVPVLSVDADKMNRNNAPDPGARRPGAMMDIALAQWRLERLGRLTRLDIKVTAPARMNAVRDAITRLLPPGVAVTTPTAQSEEAARISRAFRANLSALALVALFTGGFLVYSTQSLAVLRRRRELGLLHALGLTRREELWLILASAAIVGIVGALCGTVLGAIVADLGIRSLGADLGAGYFTDEVILHAHWFDWGAFVLLGVFVSIVSALAPALEAYRIPPASALKASNAGEPDSHTHSWIGVSCLIAGAAALTLPAADGLPLPGYAAIGLWLIGTVFLMPIITRVLLGMAPPARSAVPSLVIAHLRRTRRFVSASLAGVLVSFSLMVAMIVMVASFRTSLDQWMGKLLQADIYVRAGPSQQSAFIDREGVNRLRSIAGVTRVDAIRTTFILFGAQHGRLALSARPVQDPAKDLWLVAQSTRSTPAGALPVWISEGAADLNRLAPGAQILLPIDGRPVHAFVRGVWRDYEHQSGAIALDYADYVRVSGDERVDGVRLWLASTDAKQQVLRTIEQQLPGAALDIRFPGEVRANALRMFDRTFAVTYVLEALAVVIGLSGIGATNSAHVLARRSEFAVLRSLGLTRRQIGGMLACEGAGLGAVGAVAGVALGWLISLVLVYVVNRQSFHWSMDVHVPGTTLAALSAILIGAAAATSVWSGRSAMSNEIVTALKEDW